MGRRIFLKTVATTPCRWPSGSGSPPTEDGPGRASSGSGIGTANAIESSGDVGGRGSSSGVRGSERHLCAGGMSVDESGGVREVDRRSVTVNRLKVESGVRGGELLVDEPGVMGGACEEVGLGSGSEEEDAGSEGRRVGEVESSTRTGAASSALRMSDICSQVRVYVTHIGDGYTCGGYTVWCYTWRARLVFGSSTVTAVIYYAWCVVTCSYYVVTCLVTWVTCGVILIQGHAPALPMGGSWGRWRSRGR